MQAYQKQNRCTCNPSAGGTEAEALSLRLRIQKHKYIFLTFLKKSIHFMCMGVFACMYACASSEHAWCPQMSEFVRFLGSEITQVVESFHVGAGSQLQVL